MGTRIDGTTHDDRRPTQPSTAILRQNRVADEECLIWFFNRCWAWYRAYPTASQPRWPIARRRWRGDSRSPASCPLASRFAPGGSPVALAADHDMQFDLPARRGQRERFATETLGRDWQACRSPAVCEEPAAGDWSAPEGGSRVETTITRRQRWGRCRTAAEDENSTGAYRQAPTAGQAA